MFISSWLAGNRRAATALLALVRFVLIPVVRHWLHLPISPHDIGVRLRAFLDRGGLIYRKLGQYLAMRTDLLPAEVCKQLDALFEAVTPMPGTEVERLIEAELGRPWRECFSELDMDPIGSASVAQVHRATSLDQQQLALKIQRPGLQEELAADVRVFNRVARLFDLFRLTGTLSISELFIEFARFTARELDFEHEGHAADDLRRHMSPRGHVPLIRWDLTTPRLLAMEFIAGPSVLTICRLHETGRKFEFDKVTRGLDLHQAVTDLANESFHELFISGFFHGDPHPGNVILRKDGSFAFLDCGITGSLTLAHRRNFSSFVENMALGRFYESAFHYTRLCEVTASTDIDAWMNDVATAIAAWWTGLADPHASIEHRHIGRLQGDIAIAMRKHSVRTLPNQVLVWRALVLLDTTTLRLPVRFDVLGALESFFRRYRYNYPEIMGQLFENWLEEAPGFARETLVPAHLSLVGHLRPLAVSRLRSTGSGGQRAPYGRFLCAMAGLIWATVTRGVGSGELCVAGAATSAVFLLFAMRR